MARIIHKTSTQSQNNKEVSNKEIKYLKKEEWRQLIESIDNYRDKLIVKLLYTTGMRVGELANLKVEDIDFQERFIHIPAENTKTNTARTVAVPKEALSDVQAYLKITRNRHRINKETLFNLTIRRITATDEKVCSESQFRGFSTYFKAYPHSPCSLRPYPHCSSTKTSRA